MAEKTKEQLAEEVRKEEAARLKAEEAATKVEDARLEKLHEEHDREEGIIEERKEEAQVKSLVLSVQRQKFLSDLIETLRIEGIRSLGDVENKLAQANQEVVENSKSLSEATLRRLERDGIPDRPGSTSTTVFVRQ